MLLLSLFDLVLVRHIIQILRPVVDRLVDDLRIDDILLLHHILLRPNDIIDLRVFIKQLRINRWLIDYPLSTHHIIHSHLLIHHIHIHRHPIHVHVHLVTTHHPITKHAIKHMHKLLHLILATIIAFLLSHHFSLFSQFAFWDPELDKYFATREQASHFRITGTHLFGTFSVFFLFEGYITILANNTGISWPFQIKHRYLSIFLEYFLNLVLSDSLEYILEEQIILSPIIK